MPQKLPPEAEEPRGRVEIIPPGAETRANLWISTGSHQFKIVKLGPIGSILLALTIGALSVMGLIFLTGVFLVLIPVLVVLAIVAYLFGGPTSPFRRLR